nr:MAG: nucleoprotein [Mononegavirales sp.]
MAFKITKSVKDTEPLIYFGTGQPFQIDAPNLSVPTQYPQSWFSENKGKPAITIKVPSSLKRDPTSIARSLRAAMNMGEVKSYLVEFGLLALLDGEKLQRDKKDLKWESFGREITKDGVDNVRNIVDIMVEVDDTLEHSAGDAKTEGNLYQDLVVCLSIVRVGREQNVAGKAILQTKLDEAVRAGMAGDVSAFLSSVNVLTDLNLFKLMAAVDMLLFTRKESSYPLLRLGTVITRYRDCTFLSEVSLMEEHSQMKVAEACTWILSPMVGLELSKTFKTGQETSNPESYMPYMMDLGLVMRSPYSSSENPKFHTWVHIVGVLQGKDRSKKAAVLGQSLIGRIFKAAALAAYRWTTSDDLAQVFGTATDKNQQETIGDRRTAQLIHQMGDLDDPEEATPGAYADWAREEYPTKLFLFIDRVLNGQHRIVRNGAMGESVRTYWEGSRESLAPNRALLAHWRPADRVAN